jgi:hypothetical protein
VRRGVVRVIVGRESLRIGSAAVTDIAARG